ncbi:MAG: hypothetical protein ACI4MA_00345 [Treponema sp.]
MEESKYAEPYLACGKNIIKIGASFSTNERNLSEWKIVRE